MPTIQIEKREGQIRTRRSKDRLIIEQDWYFRILADNLSQDRFTILHSTSGVPQFNVQYGIYGMFLQGADAERVEEYPLFWDCVYHLSNTVEEGETNNPNDGSQQTGDPTEWIPWFDIGFEDYDEVLRESLEIYEAEKHPDIGGIDTAGYNATKWVNSAGQPYEQGFVRQKRIITRQFTQFDPLTGPNAVTLDDIEERNGLLNDRVYLGKPKRTLLLRVDKASVGVWYGKRCIRGEYTIHYKAEDWRLKQLDTGWYYVDPSRHPSGIDPEDPPAEIHRLAFLDDNNASVGSLDGKGRKAANPYKPAIRYHKEFREDNFAAFLRLV